MLLKFKNREQFDILGKKLERSGIPTNPHGYITQAQNRIFYQILGDMGFQDSRMPGKRAMSPNYKELGMDRVAGPPDATDIEKYRQVTDGADLTEEGLVTPALLSDTDLVSDRYAVKTLNLMVDFYSKYLGRANDFNHSFDTKEARSRIIDMQIGTDPNVQMHPDTPIEALKNLSPSNPFVGIYTALWATLAFPYLEDDPDQTIQRVQNGMLKDISLAFQSAPNSTYCSVCLLSKQPQDSLMSRFLFWTYCGEHGFPGGRTEDGKAVVSIMDGAEVVVTFGIVSDGAVKRAGIVLDPFVQSDEPDSDPDDNSESNEGISDEEVQFWIDACDRVLNSQRLYINKITNEYDENLDGRADWNDAAFAVIEKGAKKVDGKSTPDSMRHLPHHAGTATDGASDSTVKLNLLRNALARMNQIKAHKGDSTSRIRKKAKSHLVAHARRLLPNTKYHAQPALNLGTSAASIFTPQITLSSY